MKNSVSIKLILHGPRSNVVSWLQLRHRLLSIVKNIKTPSEFPYFSRVMDVLWMMGGDTEGNNSQQLKHFGFVRRQR
jgi:hypothetical protein